MHFEGFKAHSLTCHIKLGNKVWSILVVLSHDSVELGNYSKTSSHLTIIFVFDHLGSNEQEVLFSVTTLNILTHFVFSIACFISISLCILSLFIQSNPNGLTRSCGRKHLHLNLYLCFYLSWPSYLNFLEHLFDKQTLIS